MKFGKLLTKTSDDMPEMHELFLRYKQLKKLLKAIPNNKDAGEQASAPAAAPAVASGAGHVADSSAANGAAAAAAAPDAPAEVPPAATTSNILSDAEQEFIKMLNEDLSRLNQFFIDKEEDAVIRLQLFGDQLQSAKAHEQLQQIKTTLVHFHGEMVLMLHWSLLNYAAVVKILKKHDKRTGLLLRAPYLSSVLQQPFYSTSIMSRLVKRAEDLAQQALMVAPQNGEGGMGSAPTTSSAEASTAAAPDEHALQLRHQAQLLKELQESANHIQEAATGNAAEDEMMAVAERLESQGAEVSMFRKTRLALETWALLGRTASTPSTVLPTNAHHHAVDAGQDAGANASAAGDSAAQAGGTVSHVTGGAAATAAEEGRDSRGNSSDATAPAPAAGNGVRGHSDGSEAPGGGLHDGVDGRGGGTGAGGKRTASVVRDEEEEEEQGGGTGAACKKARAQGSS